MKKREIPEIFKTQKLLDKTLRKEILLESLIDTNVIGLLFSASWCPPNAEFITSLKKSYVDIKEKYSNFEIIYISFDDTEQSCNQTFVTNHGNWLMWPFDSELIQ